MSKKTLLPLISVIIIIMLTGCLESNQENNIKIDYQTFYSDNIRLPDALAENLTQEGINEIVKLGEALSFQIDYPLDWKAEFNMQGIGQFAVIFYPENTENIYLKSITFDLILVQNTTINKIIPDFRIPFTSYTENFFDINDEIDVWKITGTPQTTSIYTNEYHNFIQGIAHILYDNSEHYLLQTFFNDSDQENMIIFDDMINSFGKIE